MGSNLNILRFTDMSKKIILVFLITLTTVILSFTGCSQNSVKFYFGTSKTPQSNTELELNKSITVRQEKEKIKNSELVFNKNSEDKFDNMYVCFTGKNIKKVVATSKNKTVLYENYSMISERVDIFDFYCTVDDDEIQDPQKATVYLENKWDLGEFDDIRNVYLNGLTAYEINRTRLNYEDEIGSFSAVFYNDEELNKIGNDFFYLDELSNVKGNVVAGSVILRSSDSKELPEEDETPIIQGESVETNSNVSSDSFLYRYEKLFYESQQRALKEKDSFSYDDLSGETLEIKVEYIDETTQNFNINIAFDENGNIIATLR